ncbi:RNA recognition motif domain-containing protein [Vibrio quintilis]|uniref:RNA recognition motif. (A.k.a. RRM, RBD, or RNP domain) n=1 Tax=Vibrio quintilis TaxID=1117707 RepID=A0A1M7YXG3_9VIBR|nr:RNA-binding protein [Vibrio quintilis]SHO57223.1 RNA recognition motif. (a.k.a. RRM, RBD, or RNP domain) [Vibrio quintilis]
MNLNKSVLWVTAYSIIGVALLSQISLSSFIAFLAGTIGATAIVLLNSREAKAPGNEPIQSKTTTLYVGNLPYKANESNVKTLFSQYGDVFAVRLMKDKRTGKRRGFGFVVMPSSDAPTALENLNEHSYMDRTLKVRVANDPKSSEAVESD